jgi:hypothetical protein
MCDCQVTRIAVDAAGLPLDLGRAQRLFTGEQRRAIIARDRECIWPGCRVPARWCEIHHLQWWERDHGSTSVDNGGLTCSFHHHETHRRDLGITRVVHRPDQGSLVDPATTGRRRRAPGEPAAVEYEFRDRAGRLVGDRSAADDGDSRGSPPAVTPGGGPTGGGPPTRDQAAGGNPPEGDGATPPGWPSGSRPGGAPGSRRGTPDRRHPVSRPRSAPESRGGEPDWEWVTDPMTGARAPSFMVPQ